MIAAAERHELQTYRSLRAGLEDLRKDVRAVLVQAEAQPAALVLQVMGDRVRLWTTATKPLIVSAVNEAANAGALAVEEVTREATELDLPVLSEARIGESVDAIGKNLSIGLVSQVVALAGGTQNLSATLGSVGRESPIFGRAIERITGLAAAEMGFGWGAAMQRRGNAGMKKRWALGKNRNHRRTHADVSRRDPIPWSAKFQVGGYETPYPRGPGLPARETRHCACRLVPVTS